MKFKITQNGVLCNKCFKREMIYYRGKGENIGHLFCSGCDNLVPMARGCYSELGQIALDIYEKGNYEIREILVHGSISMDEYKRETGGENDQ